MALGILPFDFFYYCIFIPLEKDFLTGFIHGLMAMAFCGAGLTLFNFYSISKVVTFIIKIRYGRWLL